MLIAKDIMHDIISLEPNNTLADARDLMLKYNISRVVITSNGKPVGILTEKSIGKFLYRDGRALDELRLDQVMRRDLIMVNGNTSVKECSSLMLKHDISSLIIKDNERYGIITKSDLVKVYAEYFKNKSLVKDYMTGNVHTVLATNSLHKVLSILIKNKISRVIVVKENKPIGIITFKDLLPTSMLIEKEEYELTHGNINALIGVLLAKDIMHKPITVMINDDLAKAALIMIEKRISGLPVVNADNDLRGVITKTDIIRALSSN